MDTVVDVEAGRGDADATAEVLVVDVTEACEGDPVILRDCKV